MIIILEGPCGVGKTTLAHHLSHILHIPVYRPFRGPDHKPDPEIGRWLKNSLHVNSWQEDMYVADVLAGLKPSCILDRSMPSALAHAVAQDGMLAEQVIKLWGERIVRSGASVVCLGTNDEERQRRLGATLRYWHQETALIDHHIANAVKLVPGFAERYRFIPSDAPVERMAARVIGSRHVIETTT